MLSSLGQTLEAKKFNKSLSALGMVSTNALTDPKVPSYSASTINLMR